MKRYVIGIGEVLWDVLPSGRQLGGAPANFAFHVGQHIGLDGVMAVSALGQDALADETETALASHGLRFYMPRVEFPTGTVQVSIDSRGVPSYDIREGVAWDNIPFDQGMEELARGCRAVCFGTLAQRNEVSRRTIQRFLDLTPDDCVRIFDINLRQHFYSEEIITASMGKADILKINDEELPVVAEMMGLSRLDAEEQCRRLMREFGLKMVVLTCGAEGSRIFAEDETLQRATPRVEVADTVGAGDSFTGALCAALLNGASIADAHRLAVDVSAFVCTQHGAMPSLPQDLRL